MVVVPLVSTLVAGGMSGDFNAANQSLVLERFERAVDGCDSQRGNGFLSQHMNLVRKEGASLAGKNRLDGFLLFCGAPFE